MELSSVDRMLVPAYTTIAFGWALDDASIGAHWPAFARRLELALHETVRQHFQPLQHELRHDDSRGFYLADALLPPLLLVSADTEAVVPYGGCDEPVWQPSLTARDVSDPEADAAVGERCVLCHVCLLAGGAGLSLLVRLHHTVGDADSIIALLAAWSQRVEAPDAPLAVAPCHARHLLQGDASLWRADAPLPPIVTGPLAIAKETAAGRTAHAAAVAGASCPRYWAQRYAPADIAALKAQAAADGLVAATTFEVLGAEALRRRAGACGDASELVRLQFPANLRTRYPAVGAEYFGNAIVGCVTTPLAASAVAALPLGVRALLVREAKLRTTAPAAVAELLAWEAARTHRPRVCYESAGAKTILTSWAALPLFALCFGLGRPPLCARPFNAVPIPVGYVLPAGPAAPGALDVIVHLGDA